MTLEWVLSTLQQWVLFAGVGVVVGCVAWRAIIVPRAALLIADNQRTWLLRIERRVAGLGAITVLVLVAAWGVRGVVQVMGFRDPFVPLSEDVSFLLFETFWGTVWMAQGAILPLLAVAFWRARGSVREETGRGTVPASGTSTLSPSWGFVLALVLMLVATLALSSHAMGVDSGRPFIVAADAVHTLASGSWIGSLGIILTVGHPTEQTGEDVVALFAAQLRGFSPMAVVSVSILIAMGVVLAWTHLGVLSDLWTTSYGRILSAKIGTAGLVFAAGLWNWRVGLPFSDTRDGAAAVRRRAVLEVSLAVGVMLLTAVLVHSAKP